MFQKLLSYSTVIITSIITSLSIVLLITIGDFFFEIFNSVKYQYWWAPLLWTPIVTVLVVYLLRKIVPDAGGTGSPHAIIGTDPRLDESLRSRFTSVKIAVGKIFFTAGSFLAGLSLGNEGPAVQIGASLMHSARRWTKYVSASSLIMIGNGIGLAVCFGSALGGILYCAERMSGIFFQTNKVILGITITIAAIICLISFGIVPHFGQIVFDPMSWKLLLPTIGIILISSVVASMWSQALIYGTRSDTVISKIKTKNPLWFAFACAIIVAILGLLTYGSINGTSAVATHNMFISNYSYWFLPTKFLASMFTAWSGVSAGMFVPMLNMGGGVGAMIADLFGNYSTSILVVFGMVAFLSAVSRAPLCSCFIVSDAVGNYNLILPMLIIAGVSLMLSSKMSPDLWNTQVEMLLTKFNGNVK